MKKQNNLLKNIPIYITLGSIFIGVIAGFVKSQAQIDNTKERVDKNEKEIKEVAEKSEEELKEVKDESKELEKSLEVTKKEQEGIAQQVQQINIKQDKIYDLLIDIKNKKK